MKFIRHFLMEGEQGDGSNNGGGAGDQGDKGGEKKTEGGGGDGGEKKTEVVDKAELDRALKDLHRYKSEAQKARDERKALEESRMKEQNQWKELAEAREKEANDAKAETANLKSTIAYDKRFNAVKEKCQALGIRPEAISDLEGLDLESITLETTSTGRLNVLGADKFAERLKTLKPHWFAPAGKPNVDTTTTRVAGSGNGGAITPADLVAAEREGRKKGDMRAYNELFVKYRQQRAGGKSA